MSFCKRHDAYSQELSDSKSAELDFSADNVLQNSQVIPNEHLWTVQLVAKLCDESDSYKAASGVIGKD